MKKLRKVKTNLQDSIEAYEGICNCAIVCFCNCSCVGSVEAVTEEDSMDYSDMEARCLSISNSHWSWA